MSVNQNNLFMVTKIINILKTRDICKLDELLSDSVQVHQIDDKWYSKYEWIDQIQNKEIQYLKLIPISNYTSNEIQGVIKLSANVMNNKLVMTKTELTLQLRKDSGNWQIINSSVNPIN